MNTRDPFSLRRGAPTASAFLRGGADFAARSVNEIQARVEQYSTAFLESDRSSSTSPSPVGMSNATSRHSYAINKSTEQDTSWQQRRSPPGVANGVGEKVHDLFMGKSNDELPMYKDKPYNYTASGRRGPWWKQYRPLPLLLGVFVLLVYYFSGSGSITSVTQALTGRKDDAVWEERQQRVKEAFKMSWKAYEDNAWGKDEYHPVSKAGRNMVDGGMGWIIVDALDTMMLMNLTTELNHAREWMKESLTYDKDHDVNTFETTIRMLGGLLSAHYLSNTFPDMAPVPAMGPDDDDFYLERAGDLANRLMGAYESKSGLPFASVNLATHAGIMSHADGGASSTAEAATLQLEMKYLSNLTGETSYWETAERAIKIIDDNGAQDGLVPIFISADAGVFSGQNIRFGSRGDSYYEYLIKQYLQTSREEPVYNEMWEESLAGVRKHLITHSKEAHLTILAERPNGLDNPLFPKMDHLVCFMPGTIALAATGGKTLSEAMKLPTWGAKQEANMGLARELMKTCWGMYKVTATGLSPEIAHFHVDKEVSASSTTTPYASKTSVHMDADPNAFDDSSSAPWRTDYDIHGADYHNLQRPETVESLFYLYRITGDPIYRSWGWTMFQSFISHTFVSPESGFSSIDNVDHIPASFRDNMESFWLAETLKYFYLLFGREDVLPLDKVVFNTEAHPFPVFEMGRLFKTGWKRKARDRGGKIVEQHEKT